MLFPVQGQYSHAAFKVEGASVNTELYQWMSSNVLRKKSEFKYHKL